MDETDKGQILLYKTPDGESRNTVGTGICFITI